MLRNKQILDSYMSAIRARRVLVGSLFNKVTKLSVKSMTETNSGKLIGMISADIFAVERGLGFCTMILAAPFINLFAYYLLYQILDLRSTLIALGTWGLLLCLHTLASNLSKKAKDNESKHNDERLKLVNDLVVGCRTIKCYGWEHHYVERILDVRKLQSRAILVYNIMATMGTALF